MGDYSKRIGFNAQGNSSTTTTLSTFATGNRTIGLPDANCNLIGDNTTQSLANKKLIDLSTTFVDAVDNSKTLIVDVNGSYIKLSTTLATSQTSIE